MKHITLEQRRSRMANLKRAALDNCEYGRRMYVRDYLPGQVVLPADVALDEQLFAQLKDWAEAEVDLIELSGVEDACREEMKELVGLCHYFKMKVIPQISIGLEALTAEWRCEQLPQIMQLVDACDFDGVFCDISALVGAASAQYSPQLEDTLWMLYAQVRDRGGICKLYSADSVEPICIDKVYDYIQIHGKAPVGYMSHAAGYVVPGPEGGDDRYVRGIPFLQFPAAVEDGKWKNYLKLYKPMVEENSLVYVDIRKSKDIISELPEGVYATMYINEEKYLAVSNLSNKSFTLKLRDEWQDRDTGVTASSYIVEPADILLLQH